MALAGALLDHSCACFLAGWLARDGGRGGGGGDALHDQESKTCMSPPKRQPAAGLCGAGGRCMNDLRGPAVALGSPARAALAALLDSREKGS